MDVEVVIEIPKLSMNKYEYDHARQAFVLDRVLYSSVHYPTDYGYIPETLGEDGDPLDVLVVLTAPTFPGCLVRARVVGALVMEDEKGRDVKILSVAVRDPRNDDIRELDDVGSHLTKEIENFFSTYKALEGKVSRVDGWRGQPWTSLRAGSRGCSLYRRQALGLEGGEDASRGLRLAGPPCRPRPPRRPSPAGRPHPPRLPRRDAGGGPPRRGPSASPAGRCRRCARCR